MPLRVRRGTNAERQTITPDQGELIYTTDTKRLYIGDGVNAGGLPVTGDPFLGLDNVVEDQSPELGGNLSMNNFDIVGNGNINTTGEITANKLTLQSGNGSGLSSNLVPVNNNSVTLGNAQKRFKNIYATTINVDGELNLASVNADIVGDDSTILIDSATSRITTSQLAQASATDGQILKWNQSNNKWQPATNSIALLADVNATNPQDGQVLVFDSTTSKWIPQASSGNGVIPGNTYDISITGDVLAGDSTVLVNVATQQISASGGFTGDVAGNLTGDVLGNITGDVTGNITGNVVATDSTLLLNAVDKTIRAPGGFTGALTGNVLGNVTGTVTGDLTGTVTGDLTGNVVGNVVGNTTGYHTGDMTGSVFANDSTLLVDGTDGTVSATIITDRLEAVGGNAIIGRSAGETGGTSLSVRGEDGAGELRFRRNSAADLTGDQVSQYGSMFFERNDANGLLVTASITSGEAALALQHSTTGVTGSPAETVSVADGKLGVGKYVASEALDVEGNAVVSGFVQFGSLTTLERDALTAANGMVIYNTTNNKFEGYQNGGWINLDDGLVAS